MKNYTLLTKEQVAEMFGWKNPQTVTRYVREGKIPSECYQIAKVKGKRKKLFFRKEILEGYRT